MTAYPDHSLLKTRLPTSAPINPLSVPPTLNIVSLLRDLEHTVD